jgi:hypothetical protein
MITMASVGRSDVLISANYRDDEGGIERLLAMRIEWPALNAPDVRGTHRHDPLTHGGAVARVR